MTGSAIIVGVGGGLGAALARRFAAGGLGVVVSARSRAVIDPLAKEIGTAIAVPADATSEADVEALFAAAAKAFGPPALVVYNAGAFRPKSILETTPADVEHCFRVGALGGFLVGRAAARAMVARGSGTIILTGATASLRGSAKFFNLAVGKFALRALAQSMARELGPQGVHIAHVVIDGQIAGPYYEKLKQERGPDALLDPAAIAETYWQLHQQHRSAWTLELDVRPWVEKF
ncbi:MAG: SDR family NAD(P)-dependent oxidoreductase [Alphaproteobacteria bacterium]|nr:SDR family NAD(P)-dependent oxidoreductase [Alphaproteobacteria bacterium]